MKVKKGDWVRYISRGFHPDHLREGIVVEALSPDLVRVLYTGANSPDWVDVFYLEKIENENET